MDAVQIVTLNLDMHVMEELQQLLILVLQSVEMEM